MFSSDMFEWMFLAMALTFMAIGAATFAVLFWLVPWLWAWVKPWLHSVTG